jgi:phage host-nuclease inhibitor protein Gam
MMHYLEKYFGTVQHKVTATEENYRLPSGKLVMKKPSMEFERDDESLLSWLKENGHPEFIKTKESVDWSSLKKTLVVVGGSVTDEDGQIVPCITAVEKPAEFKIAK